MNKDLHDIDELFRSGLEGYQAVPSPGVKEGLDAALAKKEAEKYKKRFIIWKRSALLLLLLLAGFILFDSGLITTGNNRHTTQKSVDDKGKETSDKNGILNNTNTSGSNTITSPSVVQNNNGVAPADQRDINTSPSKRSDLLTQPQDLLFPISSSQPVKKTIDPADQGPESETFISGIEPLDTRTSLAYLTKRSPKDFSLFSTIVASPNISITNPKIENNTGKKKNNSFKPFWSLTPFVSYDQAGYRLDSDEPSAITSIKFREANEPSYSAGLLLSRQVLPRFSLQSGIVYRNTAIGMKPQKTYAFTDPTGDVAYKYITSSGYAFFKPGFGPQPSVGDSLTTAEGKHKLENISIPLMAKYTALDKKISITAGAGIEANFKTRANLEVDIEDPFNREIVVIRKLNGTKSFYFSFIADAEIKYNLNKKVSVSLRPVYRTALSPITKNIVVETFPHSFGLGAGVTIKF